LIKKDAYEKIEDHEHLDIFFAKLHEHFQKIHKQRMEQYFERIKKLAKENGLSDAQYERFVVIVKKHFPMDQGHCDHAQMKVKWDATKKETLDGLEEEEKELMSKFLTVVEKDWESQRRHHHRAGGEHSQHRRRHHHHSGQTEITNAEVTTSASTETSQRHESSGQEGSQQRRHHHVVDSEEPKLRHRHQATKQPDQTIEVIIPTLA